MRRIHISLVLLSACADSSLPEALETAQPLQCAPLTCGPIDCGPQLGPANRHGSEAALGFDIHPGTGNLHLAAIDAVIEPAVGVPLVFVRHYNSQADATNYGFGAGWSHSFSWRASLPATDIVRIVTDEGRAIVFTGPAWTPPAGEYGSLTGSAVTGFTYTTRTGTVYRFDTIKNQGRLLSIASATSPSPITIAYTSGADISTVTSGAGYGNNRLGSSLQFAYSGGMITAITDPLGRQWRYRTGSVGLDEVARPNGGSTRYTMTNVSVNGFGFRSGSGKVTRIQSQQSPGVWVDDGLFSYEGDPGQITHAARGASGGTLHDEVSLAYQLCADAPSITTATLDGGSKTITSEPIAGAQRVISIAATAGSGVRGESTSTTMIWNPDRTLARVSSGTGTAALTTSYSNFDAKGNARTVVEGVGSSAERTTQFTFHPVLQSVLTSSRTGVDGSTPYVVTNDYDADYDASYNTAPTVLLRQIVETGKTDTNLTGAPATAVAYTTRITYDAANRPTQVTYPNARSEQFTYFAPTALAAAQERLETHFVYTTGTNVLVDRVSRYDDNGRALETQDANGVITTFAFDELGRVTSSIATSGGQSSPDQFAYNLAGQLVSSTSPSGARVVHDYDSAGRPWRTRSETASGSTAWSQVATFDRHGQLLAQRRFTGLGSTVNATCIAGEDAAFCESMTYDSFRRRATYRTLGSTNEVCAGDACSVSYAYDANGNTSCSTEAGLHTTCFERDGRARLVGVQYPDQTRSAYVYDAGDHLISRRDARSRVATFVWDDFGRQIARTTLDSGRFIANYDGAGLRTSTLDARGIRIDSAYDLAGRPTTFSVPSDSSGNQNLTYVYDEVGEVPGNTGAAYAFGRGRLTTIRARATDGSQIVTHKTYDYLGRIADEVEERGASVTRKHYQLGVDGELLSYTYPSGEVATFQFPSNGGSNPPRPSSATAPLMGGTQIVFSGATYFSDGALEGITYATGDTRLVTRNKRGDATRIVAGPLMSPWVDQRMEYDANGRGRLTAIRNFVGMSHAYDWTYETDAMNRKTRSTNTVDGGTDVRRWTYDEVGNRTSETRNSGVTTYNYASGTNRLTGLSGADTDTFTYDANGFVTSHDAPGKRLTYAYDAQNRLTKLRDEKSAPGSVGLPASITFTYLATSCGSASIQFRVNGTLAATAAANAGCTCTPGISTIVVTDPAILGVLTNGANTFSVAFPQYLAWAMATVDGNDFVIYDAAPGANNDARTRNPDLCGAGYGYNAGPQSMTTPSIASVTFTWLATSCSGAQPIAFSINGTTAYSTSGNAGCTCTPGIQTHKTSDPSVLALLQSGTNNFGVSFPAYLAWAVATVQGRGDVIIYDPAAHAAAREPNLCSSSYGGNVTTSASSPSYVAQQEVTYTYDGNGRIWERRLGNGRFTQIYYDAAGRVTEEREFRGEMAFGSPVYVITDFVYASDTLVAKIVKTQRRPAPAAPYHYVDTDLHIQVEDLRSPTAIVAVYQHPGLSWEANTDAYGNWHNLGSRHESVFGGSSRAELEMTVANLGKHGNTRVDPSDWLTTGLDHGSKFTMSAYDRLGGPQLDGMPDGSSYMRNQINDALGSLAGLRAPKHGNGPEWSFRAPNRGLVGFTAKEHGTSDVPKKTSLVPETSTKNETVVHGNSVPKEVWTTDAGTAPKTTSEAEDVGKKILDVIGPLVEHGSFPTSVATQPQSQPGDPPSPDDYKRPDANRAPDYNKKKMCNPDAMGEACGGDTTDVGAGTPFRNRGDWISHPIHPDFADGGRKTMNVRKPSVIDPMEPEATVSVDLGPPNLTNIGCASSYKPCGNK